MTIGEKIRKLREEKNLSQKEVALTIELDRSQFSRIETNKSEATVSTLEKIAQTLGVKTAYFFQESQPLEVNAFDKTLVEKVKLIDDLEDQQKNYIYGIIDMAITNKRLKDTLNNALQFAQ